MSWIAECDTQGREFPTCVHVTKTTGTMTHGATYVPIEDGKAVRAENAKLRELCSKLARVVANDDVTFRKLREIAKQELGYDFIGAYDSSLGDMDQLPLFSDHMRELGVEVPDD